MASEQNRPNVARRRAQWRHDQPRIDLARLIVIDETWTKTNVAPLRGWGPVGDIVLGKAPYGHWNTMTFIDALRHDRIDTPWLLGGSVNGKSLRVYVEQMLAPTLRCGDVVVMDNLSSYEDPAIRHIIHSAGAKLVLLPNYLPDLNPIEQVFAKHKHLLRKAAAGPHARRGLHDQQNSLGTDTASECANYLKNS